MNRASALLAVLVVTMLAAPILAPYAPDAIDLERRREVPTAAHWFGTDDLGRDVLSRTLYGGRVSIAVGLLAALLAVAAGVVVGAAAGYAGGWLDALAMRATDAVLSMPRLLVLMVAAAVLAPSVSGLVVLIGAVSWMETARVTRASVRAHAASEFVLAALAAGAGHVRIVGRHLLSTAAGAIRTSALLAVGRAMVTESVMSFFGVGVQPPAASWGSMLYQAQATMATEPWLALFPGLCLVLTLMALTGVLDRG